MNPLSELAVVAILYFMAGLGREILTISYYRSVIRKKDYSASGLAGGIEAYDFLILATIIRSGWNPLLITSYIIGTMAGTFISMRISK
jgi:hypothetical protein